MTLRKLFIFIAVIVVVLSLAVQSEAGWFDRVFQEIEAAGQRVQTAADKGIAIAQQGRNVLDTLRGAGYYYGDDDFDDDD